MPQIDSRVPRSADEVVDRLWRAGKVPEWIDITPYEVIDTFLYSELRCCGRFTDEEKWTGLHLTKAHQDEERAELFGGANGGRRGGFKEVRGQLLMADGKDFDRGIGGIRGKGS